MFKIFKIYRIQNRDVFGLISEFQIFFLLEKVAFLWDFEFFFGRYSLILQNFTIFKWQEIFVKNFSRNKFSTQFPLTSNVQCFSIYFEIPNVSFSEILAVFEEKKISDRYSLKISFQFNYDYTNFSLNAYFYSLIQYYISRHNGGTSGAPLKPLRVDSALKVDCLHISRILK